MAQIALKGNTIYTVGNLPAVGSQAPDFELTDLKLGNRTLSEFKGKNVVLNIFPSVDTGTCAASVRHFNADAASLDNTVVLCISKDLPFAQGRFCGAEGIENVVMLSDFRRGSFGRDYGVEIADSPMAGLLSRSVVVINPSGEVIYTEQVAETVDEPNYADALAAL